MTGWHRSPYRPDRGPIFASIVLHVGVLAGAWALHTLTFDPVEFVAYEINIVSMADPDLPEEIAVPAPEDLVVETPNPEPPAPEPEPEPPPLVPEPDPLPQPPLPEPRQEPPPEPPRQDPPPPDPPRQTPPPSDPPPPTESETPANVDLDIRMAGLQRDYPAYYNQILVAMRTCFRQPPGVEGISTTLRFEIQRDGSIVSRSIEPFRRSGVGVFDLRAIQAVECAGQNQRIPPLPDDLPGDRLPVQFTFTTSGFRS